MFLGTCSGCIEVPTPLYYWNPYVAHAYSKGSSFQIANILQLSRASIESSKTEKRYRHDISSHRFSDDRRELSFKNKSNEQAQRFLNKYDDLRSNAVLDYSRKKGDKCTLPSALEPLEALCSEGPRGYRSSSPSSNRSQDSTSPSLSPPREQLKFGINKILSEDFGKDKTEKERSSTPEESPKYLPNRACECTYDMCHMYREHVRYPPHALSAVHALQPPKYPTSSNGTDVLPGPYSVLNTDVSMGSQSKRKRSWSRAVFSNLQRKGLEKRFEVQKYVTKPDRRQLAAMLGLTDAQVKVWFQNRRMKWRHAQQINTDEESSAVTAEDKTTKTEIELDITNDQDKIIIEQNMNMKNFESDDDEISITNSPLDNTHTSVDIEME